MLIKASKDLNIDFKKVILLEIGTKIYMLVNKVKCKTIFIDFNYNENQKDCYRSKSLIRWTK